MRSRERAEELWSFCREVAIVGEVEQVYDFLADTHHLLFEDWDRAIARQAQVLDRLIGSHLGRECVEGTSEWVSLCFET